MRAPRQPVRGPRFITGYHGCSAEAANRLIAGEQWLSSENRYDWLGVGVYFWEYGPSRALEWAERRFGAAGAVVEARIRLGRCLNLLDTEHLSGLRRAFSLIQAAAESRGEVLPTNLPDGRHFLDRLLVEQYVRLMESETGKSVQTVRGCFPEGEPAVPGSRILTKAHVQVAVRDLRCISALRLVE